MQAVFKARKRGGASDPKFTTLGQDMSQGPKYGPHQTTHGLAQQMTQGKGYDHEFTVGTLGGHMSQRGNKSRG